MSQTRRLRDKKAEMLQVFVNSRFFHPSKIVVQRENVRAILQVGCHVARPISIAGRSRRFKGVLPMRSLEHNLNPIYLPSQRDRNVKTDIPAQRFPLLASSRSAFFAFVKNSKGTRKFGRTSDPYPLFQ